MRDVSCRRSHITFLFGGTIGVNIHYSMSSAKLEEIMEAANIANAHVFIINLPEG